MSWDRDSGANNGPPKKDNHRTDLEIGTSIGVKWDVSDLLDIVGEAVIDNDTGFIFGLNFKI